MPRLRIGVPLLFLLACTFARPAVAFDDWQPISQDDLKMAFDPAHPMDAIILYHEEASDDMKKHRLTYVRIKVLTEKGKNQANVEIPYNGTYNHIVDLKARTIAPDGAITPFTGKAFDTTVVKGRGVKYLAKTFTLPNVQVGSILEFRYTEYWDDYSVWAPHWIVQSELAQKRAKFTFIPMIKSGHWVENSRGQTLDQVFYTLVGIPQGTDVKTIGDRMELELKDIPAFVEESYSPPANVLKMRVNFYYGTGKMAKPAEFWKEEGKFWSKDVERSVGSLSNPQAAVAKIVAASDPAEQKVRKIYDRVQKINNLNFTRNEGELEEIASRIGKEKRTLNDVLHDETGYRDELVHLFVALSRAAGIQAYVMHVADRDEYFFQANLPNPNQLTSEIAIVNLDGKDVFLDPGTPLCPFGMLAWQHTATSGIRQNASGTEIVQTEPTGYKDAISKRVARLTLAEDGTLKGRMALAWAGEEALSRRLNGLKTDEAGRKKELEDELKRMIASGATVHLDSIAGWDEPEKQITVWFNVEIPGFASSTGKRMLVPTALFEGRSQQPFGSGQRKHPLYFSFPFYTQDDVQISLPASLQAESLPQSQPIKTDFAFYQFQRSSTGKQLQFVRDFAMGGIAFPVAQYGDLQKFFAGVASGDSEQVVLTAAK